MFARFMSEDSPKFIEAELLINHRNGWDLRELQETTIEGSELEGHYVTLVASKRSIWCAAVYELTKLIVPNNVSAVRMRDYEDSMKWLNDAAKVRLNPLIPRKVDGTKKPVTDWQLATFQNDYDPYRNPWMV
jgi:hypothetical protein